MLFILNVYITYALLTLTALISGANTKRSRIALSALLGGVYSLIILIPNISDTALSFSRIPAAAVFIFAAFTVKNAKIFLRLFGSFFLMNFIFAGLMFALWYFISPGNMYLGGFVVYFDIEPLTLIILTAVCYFTVKGINYFIKIKQPKNSIYDITLHINDIEFTFPAFYDTGNNLYDPFTGKDVIIVSQSALRGLFPSGVPVYEAAAASGISVRFLPCNSVGGSALLPIVKAQRVHIKGIAISLTLDEAVIAITEERIKGGEFAALLPSGIFNNQTGENGADYDESNKKIFFGFKE